MNKTAQIPEVLDIYITTENGRNCLKVLVCLEGSTHVVLNPFSYTYQLLILSLTKDRLS